MGKKQHKPITSAAVDRAVLALERLIGASDFGDVFTMNAEYHLHEAREELLRVWSDLKDEGK